VRFATIEPAESRWELVEADELTDLYERLGLTGDVDHTSLASPHAMPSGVGISLVVREFSMFDPPEEQRFFAIGRTLCAGNAVLYGYDRHGESVDLEEMPVILFMTLAGVEDAIARDQINRPYLAVNGEKLWEWPQPSPFPKKGRR